MQSQQVTTAQSSAQALQALGQRKRKTQADVIHDICSLAQRSRAADISGGEIQELYERIHEKRIDRGTVSARVNELVAAKRLERVAVKRMCSVTKSDICPVRVPLAQARLVG